jgi:hypothetical protein
MNGLPSFETRQILVRVASLDAVQGIFCLAWAEAFNFKRDMGRQVIMALARQLGSAMQNLTALDSLLKQPATSCFGL